MCLPCARTEDTATCQHGAARVSAGGLVEANGRAIARLNDAALCACGVGRVARGSATVTIGGWPVARSTDRTTEGVILSGSANVLVGGLGVGGPVGAAYEALTRGCAAAAGTRAGGSTSQAYGNCGVESGRLFLNGLRARRGQPPLTEQALLDEALAKELAHNQPGAVNHGAIGGFALQTLLRDHGLETEVHHPTDEKLHQAVLTGRGAALWVNPHFWNTSNLRTATVDRDYLHVVVLTGLELDASGEVVAYYLNDTSLGLCGVRISRAELVTARQPDCVVITKAPLSPLYP